MELTRLTVYGGFAFAQGNWIDDDVADAILRLAKMPDEQVVIPKELIEAARTTKDRLGLVEFGLR